MKPVPEEWECLRLAAKAADRMKAAEELRPDFERRLKELGYGSLATAHAFATLTGPATVSQALAELAQNAQSARSTPRPLEFKIVEQEAALPLGHSITIAGVERDAGGIRITYEMRPPLPSRADRPCVEGRDDCDQEYRPLGEFLGLAGSEGRTTTIGGFTIPLPQQHASVLCVRISWWRGPTSLWERAALELQITL